jgi:hypothetical protein
VIGSRRYRAFKLNQPSQDSGDASDQVEVALVKIEVPGFDFRLAAYQVVGLWGLEEADLSFQSKLDPME